MEVKRIGVPRMGIYTTIIVNAINTKFKELGINSVEFVLAPQITKRTINFGAQCLEENVCLPAKITFGNIDDMIKAGIRIIIEWSNCGECRQKTYPHIHQSILRQSEDHETIIIPLEPKGFIEQFVKYIPEVSKKQWKIIMREVLRKIWEYDLKLMQDQCNIPPGKPRIGAFGEIYTILEPAANAGLLDMFDKYGAYVHSALNLSQFLFGPLLAKERSKKQLGWLTVFASLGMWKEINDWIHGRMVRPDIDHELFKKAEAATSKYLGKHVVGGHGRESITWAIYYALAEFDGDIHIMPFPCMPEATVSRLIDEVGKDFNISVNHLVFDQQLGEQNIITRAEAMVRMLGFKKHGISLFLSKRKKGKYIGCDGGSTTTKVVLLEGDTLEVVDSLYQRSNGDPIHTLQEVLNTLLSRNPNMKIQGIGATGSGRRLVQALLGNTIAVDEISCQTIGNLLFNPNVPIIFEIGGQDSKVIVLDQYGVPVWFNMNSICSAGTGALIDAVAKDFEITVDELNVMAKRSVRPSKITGRCGVFAISDMVTKRQNGEKIENIIAGLFIALAENFLSNVCRSQKLRFPITFAGGTALNHGVVDAFSSLLGTKIFVHPHTKVSGAIGAAFFAMASDNQVTQHIDLSNIGKVEFATNTVTCNSCPNHCDISLIHKDKVIVYVSGSVCGKYNAKIGQQIMEVI